MADVADIVTALTEIDKRQTAIAKADLWYAGKQPTVYPADIWEETFGGSIAQPRDNMAPLVVQTITSRQRPKEFVARTDTPVDNEGAVLADEILRRNRWDVLHPRIHRQISKHSIAGFVVGVNKRGQAVLYPQAGDQIYVDYDPEYFGARRWGAKRWIDGKKIRLTMYYPDVTETFEQDLGKYNSQTNLDRKAAGFSLVGSVVNGMGEPTLFEYVIEESDLVPLYTLQPAADKAFADLLVTSHTQGSPQAWITGASIGGDDPYPALGGDTTPVLGVDPDHIVPPPAPKDSGPVLEKGPTHTWFLENENARVGALPAATLDGSLKLWSAVQYAVLRSKSIPPHLATMQGSGEPVTGRAMQVAESQLAALVTERNTIVGTTHEDVIAFAVQAELSHNDKGEFVRLAEKPGLELQWGSPFTQEQLDPEQEIGYMLEMKAPVAYVLERYFGLSTEQAEELQAQILAANEIQRQTALYGYDQGIVTEDVTA